MRNKVGAETLEDLTQIEADLVMARTAEFLRNPTPEKPSAGYLLEIHQHLFQDIYDWAGDLRMIDIRKSDEDADQFAPYQLLSQNLQNSSEQLRSEDYLRALDRNAFIHRLAFHYEQLNYIHPFREGNGRVQRIFWLNVADDAGWKLDWRNVSGQMNDAACREAAVTGDLAIMRELLAEVVVGPVTYNSKNLARNQTEGVNPIRAKKRNP